MKSLFIFFSLLFCLISFSQLDFKVATEHGTDKIGDGTAEVIILQGRPPFKYYWSNPGVNIYSSKASNLVEGEEISVRVVDSTGAEKEIPAMVPVISTVEKINIGMKPAVDVVGGIFFFPIYSKEIQIPEKTISAPFWDDKELKNFKLTKWLVDDGATVKHEQPIAILSHDKESITIYAVGEGKIEHKLKIGDEVRELDESGNITKALPLCVIKYDPEYTLMSENGQPVSTSVPLIVVWLILGAVFFTVRMKFINIRGFKHAIHLVSGKYDDPSHDHGEVSHFQALTTALSATVGLGNIASVAIAISVGGAGATFWLIVAGLIGMSSKFVECTLGVKYRKINEKGEVSGGPMYYLSQGLAKRGLGGLGKALAAIFAILCIGGSFGGGNMFQANQAFAQVNEQFSIGDGTGWIFGVFLAIAVGVVIIGGIKSIAKVTDKIVPFMVIIYVTFALIIIFMNIGNIGGAFTQIFQGAFNPDAVKGGIIGVLVIGFQRAAFSNEAGVGSASIAHSAAKTDEPVSEGIVALLEPFIDTVIVCTMTSLVLIFTGYAEDPQGLTGAKLTSAAFTQEFAWFSWVLTLAILLFAFSTMISWSYYGLKAWTYLFGESKAADYTYKSIFLVFIVIGSSIGLGSVLDFSDMMILGMAFPNILGLFIMSGEVANDLKLYLARVKSGEIRKFK
ncbi:MAG: amino acid carrier protein [Crocinitomicaceae bacterium]|nr:amino acid carrier protein [Crocinitomicaceae bacterium]